MSERNFRAEVEAGQCEPNHGCNVCRACMCVLAEEAIDENDRLRARVAELEAERNSIDAIATRLANMLRRFTDPDNAPLMIMGDAHMEKLVKDARAVLAKGPSTSAQDEGAA